MAFGERERSSLFAFARTRLLAKRAIRVIRLSGKLYGREGKKKQSQEEEKNGFSRHAHAARIFSVRERRERGRGKDRAIVARISEGRATQEIKHRTSQK